MPAPGLLSLLFEKCTAAGGEKRGKEMENRAGEEMCGRKTVGGSESQSRRRWKECMGVQWCE